MFVYRNKIKTSCFVTKRLLESHKNPSSLSPWLYLSFFICLNNWASCCSKSLVSCLQGLRSDFVLISALVPSVSCERAQIMCVCDWIRGRLVSMWHEPLQLQNSVTSSHSFSLSMFGIHFFFVALHVDRLQRQNTY